MAYKENHVQSAGRIYNCSTVSDHWKKLGVGFSALMVSFVMQSSVKK